MFKKLLSAYWVHWYCLLVSGLLLSLETGPMVWFKQLPWMVWGTELGQSYALMQIPASGAVWLALFWALIALGFLGILVAAVSLVVMSFEASPAHNTIERRPEEIQLDTPASSNLAHAALAKVSPATVKPQADSSGDELAALVNDPDISHLIRQLNSRFV